MAQKRQTRSDLIGFRVTPQEHDLLRRIAATDERSVTGFLRRLLAETVTGFGTPKLPSVDREGCRQ